MNAMDNNLIDTVTYKEWVSVDRSALETLVKPVEEFVECFVTGLKLSYHIHSLQSNNLPSNWS